jgi:hypothetical protein
MICCELLHFSWLDQGGVEGQKFALASAALPPRTKVMNFIDLFSRDIKNIFVGEFLDPLPNRR